MRLVSRLKVLEARNHVGWDQAHQVIQHVGQTEDEALDEYGREKIGANDLVILIELVGPQFDAEGNRVLLSPPSNRRLRERP